MNQTEKRCYGGQEYRAVDSGGDKFVEGHAAVFEQRTNIGGWFDEVIERGAFDECDFKDVALFVNHEWSNIPLARSRRNNGNSTMTLSVDDVGLKIRAKLDVENNPDAKALWSAVSRGDLRGMSFAFTVSKGGDEWQNLKSDMPLRVIRKISKVREVSIVNFPAYEQTDVSIAARAKVILDSARKENANMEYEEFLKYQKQYEATKKDEAELNERTATVNSSTARVIERSPEYIPGRGFFNADGSRYTENQRFIPAEEHGGVIFQNLAKREQAGEALKERRAAESPFNAIGENRMMTVMPPTGSNASIVLPQMDSNKIVTDWNTVSSIVDVVGHLSFPGGDSFKQPYITDIAAGAYTKEGEDAAEAETSFGYSTISRCKITAFAEVTEELEKLPSAAYADVVFQNIRTSMRKLLAKEILFGEGYDSTNQQQKLIGILSSKATAIDPDSDYSISQITDTTLDELILNYGSDEDTGGIGNVLMLHKLDLLAFSKVRTSTKQKFYDIHFDTGNTGTISGVRFIINSNLKPISATPSNGGADSGEYCMIFGNPANYMLCEFSPLEVRRSDDFKFRRGIACFRGVVFCGGNCVKHNAFLRVKKG